jgi:serine protease
MATDQYDEKAWFSNYGVKSVDIAAPGIGIVSTRPYVSKAAETGERPALRYCRYHGTSAATAHVVGAAALLKSLAPTLMAKDLKESLKKSVAKRPGLRCAFEGRLDLGKALAGVVTP